jgi:periplasmic protein CpxP/Spy
MSNTVVRTIAVIAAALSLSIGAAQAAQADVPAGNQFMAQMKELHPQLSLNANQEALWQTALDTMRQSHAAERLNQDQLQQQREALQQQPILDLQAIHASHLKAEQQDAQLREQSANAWIAFYDGLNDQQKTGVSTLLNQQFAEIARHPAVPYEPRTGL